MNAPDPPKRRRPGRAELGLALGALVVAIAGGELLLRWLSPPVYHVWPPNFRQVFEPDPEIMPGISGTSVFSTNEIGVRGDPYPTDGRDRLLAVGGSTTECGYLDDTEAWPRQLQDLLARGSGEPVWVGNVGKAGNRSSHHRLQVDRMLTQHPDIDALLLLVGLNDLLTRLMFETQSGFLQHVHLQAASNRRTALAFSVFPGSDELAPWYRRTGWGRLVTKLRWRRLGYGWEHLVQDEFGEVYRRWRSHRLAASGFRDRPPDLGSALAEYRKNLLAIADRASRAGTRVVFITHPTLWKPEPTPEEERLLWMGGIGRYQLVPGHEYYTPGALARMMARYNRATLEVCRERGLPCVDLAAALPASTEMFFDDAHFTEAGARHAARVIADRLLRDGSFPP